MRKVRRVSIRKRRTGSSNLPILAAGLLFVWLFISPWSPSTQPGGFSLTLDLDPSEGDQAVTSLDLQPDQPVSVQIFGEAMQNSTGIAVHIAYATTQVAYVGFDPGSLLPNAHTLVVQDSAAVRINVSSLSGSATSNAGLVVAARFRTTDAFSDTEIWLVRAELTRGGSSERGTNAVRVVLEVPVPLSPDFNASGIVGFSAFVLFASVFGYRDGDEAFDGRYDLSGDEEISFDNFVIFARSFGEAVNRAPVFALASPVRRSVAANAPSGDPIGAPPSVVSDDDGDRPACSLWGADGSTIQLMRAQDRFSRRGVRLRGKKGIRGDRARLCMALPYGSSRTGIRHPVKAWWR